LAYVPGQNDGNRCRFCGELQPVFAAAAGPALRANSLSTLLEAAGERGAHADVAILHCQACGADTTRDPNVISSSCPFCARPVMASPGSRLRVPDGVLPFALTAAQAANLVLGWEQALWLKKGPLFGHTAEAPPLRPIYLPYWSFDWDVTVQYQVSAQGNSYAREGRTMRRGLTHSTVLASRTVPTELGADLEPWDLESVRAPRPELFAGIVAETHDPQAGLSRAAQLSHRLLDREVDEEIRKQLGPKRSIYGKEHTYHRVDVRLLLLPVWVASYRYEGSHYRVLVNGRNGETIGERPFSRPRILGVAAAPFVLPVAVGTARALSSVGDARVGAVIVGFWGVMFAQALVVFIMALAAKAPRPRPQGQFFIRRGSDDQSTNFGELWAAAVVQHDRWARRELFRHAGVVTAFLCIGPLGAATLVPPDALSMTARACVAHAWVAFGLFGFWLSRHMDQKEKRYMLGLSDKKP
jgi:hypothetical protein